MAEVLCKLRKSHKAYRPTSSDESRIFRYAEVRLPGMPNPIMTIKGMPDPRVMKSHLDYEFYQEKIEKEGLKAVVVLREPKDVLTSYYYFYRTMPQINFPGDFNQFFELFKSNSLVLRNILEWSAEWWTKRHLPNVLVVKYEEMKKDLARVVRRVADFLEIPVNEVMIDDIVKQCHSTFSHRRARTHSPSSLAL